MKGFLTLLCYGLNRRSKDFFIIIYNIVFPLILILLLGYISTNFFKGDSSVTSNHYYTLVLLPYFIFCSIITMVYVAKDEKLYKTSYRFIIAPISNSALVLSKIVSCTIMVWICNLIVIVATRVLLGVNLGNSLPSLLLLFLTEAFMASAIGIFMGLSFKKFDTVQGILNIPINIFAILGGVFFPVGSLGDTFEKVSYISPLTWINKGVIAAVYDKSNTILLYSISLTLVLGLLFAVLSVTSFKKEAFL